MRVERSEVPYPSAEALSQERLLLGEALDRLGRTGRSLLIDSRKAPNSTDDRLREEFKRFRVEVSRGFDKVAALVRTKVGILQVNRLVGDSITNVHAFDNEAAATAYLLGTAAPTPGGSLRPR